MNVTPMLDVRAEFSLFLVPGNLSTHLIQFFKIELPSDIRNAISPCTMNSLWFNKWCEIHFNIRNAIFYLSYLLVNFIAHIGLRHGGGVENWTFYIYGFFIWNKFSLWSRIKLPRDVIISLMYQYRLQNFIDINRIMCKPFSSFVHTHSIYASCW